jgi:hypothetical protein
MLIAIAMDDPYRIVCPLTAPPLIRELLSEDWVYLGAIIWMPEIRKKPEM